MAPLRFLCDWGVSSKADEGEEVTTAAATAAAAAGSWATEKI